MAASKTITAKPMMLGLKHASLGLLVICLVCGVVAGSIQFYGTEKDAEPSVTVVVPKYDPTKAKVEDGEEADKLEEKSAMIPWRTGEGTTSPWLPGTPPPTNPNANDEAIERGVPDIVGGAKTASSGQIPQSADFGPVKAPEFGKVEGKAFRAPASAPLNQAPAPGMHQQSVGGLIPIIGPGNRTVFDVYKKPFSATEKPKVALVVGGLGLNARITQRAIDDLPSEVTLSFVASASNLQGWIDRARAKGHEVLIEIPMEPFDYPDNDPGPNTLLTTASADENQRKLTYLLSRAAGYYGVTHYLGAKFATATDPTTKFMRELKSRGIAFIGDGSSAQLGVAATAAGLRTVQADRLIDQRPSSEDIAAQLGALEAMAAQKKSALGFGVAYSVTIDQIGRWAKDLPRRGLILAPASALIT
ncbi:divergent polysaccharide deacetylase family protein [Candidatus Phycosocius spiralis]|uniref:Divergent polysaccharide deacetylase family protein n=1 Tax=Candidatus Phycosocius spiralis TaxID=2815099 RepID=A0ABQ4PVX0_9PROT|nr:divergent polysaccharide deacetylase family protein [Candidatus Phycosocius spiralis]GIU66813.1 hypothetical protein PsB1_0967 [Candidatus Phycosocius spiralis]